MPKDKERPLGQTGATMKSPRTYALFVLIPLLLCALNASAQVVENIRPEDYRPVERPKELPGRRVPAELPEPVIDVPDEDTELAPGLTLKGVIFFADPDEFVPEGAEGSGVMVRDIELLDTDEFRVKIEPYLDKPLTWRLIRQIVKTTIYYYRGKDRPVVDVIPLEQGPANGIVQILVIEGRVGEVTVEGNKWFTDGQIRDKVHLERGDVIYASRLLEDIDFINNNPFRYVRPVLSPGVELGETDVALQVEDRIPYRFYVGYEDTGSRATDLGRYIFGVNMGNVLNKEVEFGYQYAANPSFSEIGIHSGYVRVPLENGHIIALFGSIAYWNARHLDVDYDGNDWTLNPRYIIPFRPVGTYRHELQLGFDFERNTNHIDFVRQSVYDGAVDTTQFAAEYGGALDDPLGQTSFTLSAYWSPCGISSKADKSDYHKARPGADPEYLYSHLSLERTWDLPYDATLVNRFIGQMSTDRLLGNEQLGLGGYNTVRGYDEREVNSDEGLMVSVELRSPEVSLGKVAGRSDLENRLQFLVFWDYGMAHNISRYPGEDKNTDLQSVGVGLRYKLSEYVSFRLDYGHRLSSIDSAYTVFNDQGRFHIGLLVAY